MPPTASGPPAPRVCRVPSWESPAAGRVCLLLSDCSACLPAGWTAGTRQLPLSQGCSRGGASLQGVAWVAGEPGIGPTSSRPSLSLLGVCGPPPPLPPSFPHSPGHNEWLPGRPCFLPPPGWLEPAFLPPHPAASYRQAGRRTAHRAQPACLGSQGPGQALQEQPRSQGPLTYSQPDGADAQPVRGGKSEAGPERASNLLNVTQPASDRLGLDTGGLTHFPVIQSLPLPRSPSWDQRTRRECHMRGHPTAPTLVVKDLGSSDFS